MNPEPEGMINGAWMPTVVFDQDTGVTQKQLQAAFEIENIDARVFFYPISSLPCLRTRFKTDTPGIFRPRHELA